MKFHFNVVLDSRDDETRVFTAKCLKCDAVIVGEVATDVPVVQAVNHIPPVQQQQLGRQVRNAWLDAKKGGYPFVVPTPDLVVTTLPDNGLQHALDAHMEACTKK